MKRFSCALFLPLLAVILSMETSGCGPVKEAEKISLSNKQVQVIREKLSDMREPVTLISFVGENFPASHQVSSFYDAVSQAGGKIIRQRFSLDKDVAEAQKYGISLAPAVIIQQSKDVGIRFFGLPSGYEFTSFIEIIDRLSSGTLGISPESAASLSSLKTPVIIKVFTAPS